MCNNFSFVQFPGIQPADTAISVGGATFPQGWSVDNLVENSPQFFYWFGVNGVNTLCTSMVIDTRDLTISVSRNGTSISSVATPIIVHPPHAPHCL